MCCCALHLIRTRKRAWVKRHFVFRNTERVVRNCRRKGVAIRKGALVTKYFLSVQLVIAARRRQFQEDGATAVEYALMVGLMAFAIITGVTFFGNRVSREFNVIANTIPTGAG